MVTAASARLAAPLLFVLACSSTRTASPPPEEPIVSSPLVPLPPPSPWALAVATTRTVVNQLAELPCPPPGLPPELAAGVDCAATKRFAEATVYAQRDVAVGSLPPNVDLRAHNLVGPVKDQEQVGACAGFAMSTVLDNAARRAGRAEVFSPLHVFATYAPADDLSRSLKGHAFTVEPVWPWDAARACRFAQEYQGESCRTQYGFVPGAADPYVLAERDRADASGRVRIFGFEEMPADPNQLAIVLASGEAIWAAFRFEGYAWNSLSQPGAIRLPYYPVEASTINHAVVLEGYRSGPDGREFLMHNSWGRGWGANGYAWIHESMVRTHLGQAYRALVADAAVPAPPPLPPNAFAWPAGWPAMPSLPNATTPLPNVGAGLDAWWPASVPRPF